MTGLDTIPASIFKVKVKKPSLKKSIQIVLDLAHTNVLEAKDDKDMKDTSERQHEALKKVEAFLAKARKRGLRKRRK
jgi:hypothetical protein